MSYNSETGFSFEVISVGATAVGIQHTINGRAVVRVWMTVSGAEIRYRYDGGDPTTAVGHPAADGASFSLEGNRNIRQFRMIAQSGTANVSVTYEGA